MTQKTAKSRIAIVGTGAVAQVVHLPILSGMDSVEIAGVFDQDAAKARTVARRFGISSVYESIDEIWQDESIDAVVICTPNALHEEQAVEGLGSGKYVFCEKPIALDEAGTRRIIDAAGGAGRLMIGMNQRFRPDAAALRSIVARDELGPIQYVRAGWLNRRMGRTPRTWRHRRSAGGGALMDLGIQMLDLAFWLLGYPEPRRVVARFFSLPSSEVDDTAIVLVEAVDGTVVNLEATWTLVSDREHQYLQMVGVRGSASLVPLRVFGETPNGMTDLTPSLSRETENPFTASYRQELAEFVHAVRSRVGIETPIEQVTLMKVIEAAYRSAESGSEVVF